MQIQKPSVSSQTLYQGPHQLIGRSQQGIGGLLSWWCRGVNIHTVMLVDPILAHELETLESLCDTVDVVVRRACTQPHHDH